jgi:hypothetical protein
MTMKKLMLATAIALCLTALGFADELLPAGFQPSGTTCDQLHSNVSGIPQQPIRYINFGPVLSANPDGVERTSGEAGDALRQLLGQPSREAEKEAKELDKVLQGHAGAERTAKELYKVFQEPNSYVAGIPQPPIQYITLGPVLSGQAGDTLRQILGQPSREAEKEAEELDKVLHSASDAGRAPLMTEARTDTRVD